VRARKTLLFDSCGCAPVFALPLRFVLYHVAKLLVKIRNLLEFIEYSNYILEYFCRLNGWHKTVSILIGYADYKIKPIPLCW
jgi:hypothetical protein